MLKIKFPNICNNEQIYIFDIILNKFLGINFEVEVYDEDFIEITKTGKIKNFSKLTLDASFFHKVKKGWLKIESLPDSPMKTWDPLEDRINANLIKPRIPVLYGSPGIIKNYDHLHLNLDIFGSIFFMLTRYEEIVVDERDQHDRFTANFSHAYKNKYLDRPLVDEYVEILKKCIKKLWPDFIFKEKKFTINISPDVDQISRYQNKKTFYQYLRVIGGDLTRGFIKDIIYSPLSYFAENKELNSHDPYNTFDWLMDISDQNNIKSTFNFICGKSSKFNADYDIKELKIQNLIKKINNRGHKLGLHPSYDSYINPKLIKKELIHLKNLLISLNIKQKEITSRMHYLRWKTSDTLVFLNDAGIQKDTTLGYADQAGFRCGTGNSYQGYDLLNHKKLDIDVEPLIVMDSTLFGKNYNNFNFELAFDIGIDLKKKCEKMNSQFNILWHNSSFQNPKQKEFYENLIKN